jgi:hypothetical protein
VTEPFVCHRVRETIEHGTAFTTLLTTAHVPLPVTQPTAKAITIPESVFLRADK